MDYTRRKCVSPKMQFNPEDHGANGPVQLCRASPRRLSNVSCSPRPNADEPFSKVEKNVNMSMKVLLLEMMSFLLWKTKIFIEARNDWPI